MVRNEFTFPSADGRTAIHAVEWLPEGGVRAVLQISHGVAEYILRYEPFAEYLTARGFAVVGHDHLGHGDSVAEDGARLYFGPKGSWNWVVDDIYTRRRLAEKRFPGVPYFLLGHSMGSFLARTYLIRYPGTVDGAVYMNAGAYGGEMKDVLTTVQYLTAEGEVKESAASELDLRYRHSIFEENGGCILSAQFALQPGNAADIRAKMDELMAKRVDKQPLDKPSAGSTFKRPAGAFAAALILSLIHI